MLKVGCLVDKSIRYCSMNKNGSGSSGKVVVAAEVAER